MRGMAREYAAGNSLGPGWHESAGIFGCPVGGSVADGAVRLLERLLREQCHVGKHRDGRPGDDDDDAGECKVPVALKDPKQVSADSLQSPHDPDVTYSGHKGKGYEVQVAETCHEENATQLITHVEVTPSSGSDTDVSVPVVDGLAERKVRPDELFVDTAYGSGRNAFEASRRGTELVSPVAGSAPGNSHEGERDGPPPLTAADFQIDVTIADLPALGVRCRLGFPH